MGQKFMKTFAYRYSDIRSWFSVARRYVVIANMLHSVIALANSKNQLHAIMISWICKRRKIYKMSCHGSLKYREHYADPHASRLFSSSEPIILTFLLSRAHEWFHSTALSDPHVFLARWKLEQHCKPSATPFIQNISKTKRRGTPLPTLIIVMRTIKKRSR